MAKPKVVERSNHNISRQAPTKSRQIGIRIPIDLWEMVQAEMKANDPQLPTPGPIIISALRKRYQAEAT